MGILLEIGVILLLVLLNGAFAMSELAIVSSRRARLTAMQRKGRTPSFRKSSRDLRWNKLGSAISNYMRTTCNSNFGGRSCLLPSLAYRLFRPSTGHAPYRC